MSLRIVISEVMQRTGWKVTQVRFITGARLVNKKDFSKNMKFFKVSEASIQSVYSKLTTRVFDVYVNILKYMYNARLSGDTTRSETSSDAQPIPFVATPLIPIIDTLPKPDRYKRRKKESPEGRDKQDNK